MSTRSSTTRRRVRTSTNARPAASSRASTSASEPVGTAPPTTESLQTTGGVQLTGTRNAVMGTLSSAPHSNEAGVWGATAGLDQSGSTSVAGTSGWQSLGNTAHIGIIAGIAVAVAALLGLMIFLLIRRRRRRAARSFDNRTQNIRESFISGPGPAPDAYQEKYQIGNPQPMSFYAESNYSNYPPQTRDYSAYARDDSPVAETFPHRR